MSTTRRSVKQDFVLQSVDRKTWLTHIVAGDECAEKLPLTPGQIQRRHIIVVAPEWLEGCLAKGLRVAEDKFQVHLEFCCDSGLLKLMPVKPVLLSVLALYLGFSSPIACFFTVNFANNRHEQRPWMPVNRNNTQNTACTPPCMAKVLFLQEASTRERLRLYIYIYMLIYMLTGS